MTVHPAIRLVSHGRRGRKLSMRCAILNHLNLRESNGATSSTHSNTCNLTDYH